MDDLEAMLAAATPGPWAIKGARTGGDKAIVADGHVVIAEAFEDIRRQGERAQDECAANAELIAMAPDLAAEVLSLRAYITESEGM